MRIMSGGFGLSGIAEACIDEIARRAPRELTVISNNCGNQGQGLAVLLQRRLVATVICSYVGGNPDLAEQYLSGLRQGRAQPTGVAGEKFFL